MKLKRIEIENFNRWKSIALYIENVSVEQDKFY